MSKKLWGGRFGKKIDPFVEKFTKSIQYDHKLALYDVLGSVAHVKILKKAGFLTKQEEATLSRALQSIVTSITRGKFRFDPKSEDIHTNIQNILQKKIGDVALKLHTARSRNDQVAFATKMYCQSSIGEMQHKISALINAIKSLSHKYRDIIIPGFTHMQHAQPVYLKDYLQAYTAMLGRDGYRLRHISDNMIITLGAGALAGTPINAADYSLKASGLIKEIRGKHAQIKAASNALDSVSDRDFVIEIISSLSIIAMHLSRLSEDLIIWSSKEFNFIDIDESFCTGSSLMPQKKNPDALELIRGYAGRVSGNLVSVLTMMKGLPLSYNRDMQLDKEPLFSSFDIVSDELNVLTGLIKTLTFNTAAIKKHLSDESLYATDLVYYLVGKKVSFAKAHAIVGSVVKYSQNNAIAIKDIPEPALKRFSDKFVKKEIAALFDPKVSVRSKRSVKRKKG